MIERIYDTKIIEDCPLWLVELMIEKDPLISQSGDLGLEFKGIAELKFSLN